MISSNFKLILFFSILTCFYDLASANGMGPAKMVFSISEKCEVDSKEGWNYTISTKKVSRKVTAFSFWIYCKSPVDDKYSLQVDVFKQSNGAWKNLYSIDLKKGCKEVMSRPKIFNKIARDSNITAQCPVPAGNLYFKDYVFKMDDVEFPTNILPYGPIRLDSIVKRNKKNIICISSYFDIVPLHH